MRARLQTAKQPFLLTRWTSIVDAMIDLCYFPSPFRPLTRNCHEQNRPTDLIPLKLSTGSKKAAARAMLHAVGFTEADSLNPKGHCLDLEQSHTV